MTVQAKGSYLCSLAFLSRGTLVFTCLILLVLLVICDRLCSQINDDDDDELVTAVLLSLYNKDVSDRCIHIVR